MIENDIIIESPARVEVVFMYAPSIAMIDVRHLEKHNLPIRVSETMLGSQVIAAAIEKITQRIKSHAYPVPIKRHPKPGDLVFLNGKDVPVHSQLWIIEPDGGLTVLSPTFVMSNWLNTPIGEKRKGSRHCFVNSLYANSRDGSPLVGDAFIDGMSEKPHPEIERVSVKKLSSHIDIRTLSGHVIYAAYLHQSLDSGVLIVRDPEDDDWSAVVASTVHMSDIGTAPATSVNHATMASATAAGIELLRRVVQHGRDPRQNVLCIAALNRRNVGTAELAKLNILFEEWMSKPLKDTECPN